MFYRKPISQSWNEPICIFPKHSTLHVVFRLEMLVCDAKVGFKKNLQQRRNDPMDVHFVVNLAVMLQPVSFVSILEALSSEKFTIRLHEFALQ